MAIKTRNKVSVTFSMSSMTDIVFLLLIFFIVLSTMVMPYGENVDLPKGGNRVVDKASMNVTIKPDLSYYVNGQPISRANLEAELASKAKTLEKPHLVLTVDKAVPTGETINFLSVVKKLELNIVIATQKE